VTVLILAAERDLGADAMVRVLDERAVPVFRADAGWFPQRLTLDAELRDGRWVGRLATAHREVSLQDVRSVWYRSPSTFQFPGAMSHVERRHAGHEAKLGLGGVLSSLPVLWVNQPGRHADAGHKPRQLVAAARAGLDVASTLVTNEPAAVRRFATQSEPAGVVTKMLGAPAIDEQGGRRIALTERLIPSHLEDLRGVELTAHQFQQWTSKREEARVIVIGSHVYGVAIRADSAAARVDWRAHYDSLSYAHIALPDDVERGVRAVMDQLNLVYGAFDFVITPQGRWTFLEVNPGGQFGWLEDETGLPLTATLADLLAQGAS
jgi:ATP-grasp ribosomal peptide maturase